MSSRHRTKRPRHIRADIIQDEPQNRVFTVAGKDMERLIDATEFSSETAANDDNKTSELQTVRPSADAAASFTKPANIDGPTIILTPDVVERFQSHPPMADVDFEPPTLQPAIRNRSKQSSSPPEIKDPPTIILTIKDILNAEPSDDLIDGPPSGYSPASSLSVPQFSRSRYSTGRLNSRHKDAADPQEKFAQLHEQRVAKEQGKIDRLPEEPYISDKLRQWWQDIQPGVHMLFHQGTETAAAPAEPAEKHINGVLSLAQKIGLAAQKTALPAIKKMHDRAENAAQRIVNAIDDKIGAGPPMQHVLLGPGRMVVTFAPQVSIRTAQTIIAAVQSRAIRRLVGYNAYLIMTPPGKEALFAERLHMYHEVTGVHFGSQKPPTAMARQLASGR